MLPRLKRAEVERALDHQSAVALLGPRQVGKTTLAIEVCQARGGVYLDMEDPAHRARLADPSAYLKTILDRLVVIDEVHRVPELSQVLRGLIDSSRRGGFPVGRYLLLGSASMDLLRQSSESLAGRISHIELAPFNALEVDPRAIDPLWVRGGFPGSFLASADGLSYEFRSDFIRTYLERDVPMFAPRMPVTTLERLWMMLAHGQGGLLNASALGRGLDVSHTTVVRYIDLLCDLLLVRRLQPMHINTGKRLVKSPRLYLRDSGLLHALLRIDSHDVLLGHPVLGASWEGFVIENLLGAAPRSARASFYRTASGAEIDLVLELPGSATWAVEIKRSSAPRVSRGFYEALADLTPDRAFVVHAGEERYPLANHAEAIGLRGLMELLHNDFSQPPIEAVP